MILIVGQNAAWQKVCALPRIERGEVNRIRDVRAFASSKGPNVARALAALGGESEVLGYAGGATGDLVRESLLAEGIRADFVAISADTRVCTTFVEDTGISTEVIEPSPLVTTAEREQFRQRVMSRLASARVLVIAGTSVLGETDGCYAALVREARRASVITLLDSACAQAIQALNEGPEILKVNLRELALLCGASVDSPEQRVRAWRSLAARHGVRWFLVTMGAAGMEAFDGKVHLQAEPPSVAVRNAIGSGDAASAGTGWTVHQILQGGGRDELFDSRRSLEEALVTATAMGTANCLNPMNGKVQAGDYQRIRKDVRVREIPLR